jgi:hypothetical protein
MRPPAILLPFGLVLSGCATHSEASEFAKVPEPYRTTFTEEIRDQPSSIFSKACHGDPAALHFYFSQSNKPLDGAAGEGFTASMIAIQSYAGTATFCATLRKEPPATQKAMHDCLPDLPS